MRNTYDEQIECLQHLKAGGKLELHSDDHWWAVSTAKVPDFRYFKYRPLVEKYHPEVGEMVVATFVDIGGDSTEWEAEFITEYKGVYICMESDGGCSEFHEVKPIEQPKPVAREWITRLDSMGQLVPCISGTLNSFKVREVLE